MRPYKVNVSGPMSIELKDGLGIEAIHPELYSIK